MGDFMHLHVKSPPKLVKGNLNSMICVSFENILECIPERMGDFTRVKLSQIHQSLVEILSKMKKDSCKFVDE